MSHTLHTRVIHYPHELYIIDKTIHYPQSHHILHTQESYTTDKPYLIHMSYTLHTRVIHYTHELYIINMRYTLYT